MKRRIRFDRNELAGAFGDIGTDLPLIMGMLLAGEMSAAAVLIMFGVTQIATGFWYGLPMPVQPLKVVAALVIAQQIPAPVIYGAGLALGVIMVALTVTCMIERIARWIPKCVVRGIQFGLGLKLALLAGLDFVPREGAMGYVLAAISFCVICLLWNNRRWPASLIVIGMGVAYAVMFHHVNPLTLTPRLAFPVFQSLTWPDVVAGFFILALPQIPLSLGNSILATSQLSKDLFPERSIGVSRVSMSYGVMNILNAFLGGIPVCHGSGGMAGHYLFGGRTGGSVVLYGAMFLTAGLFFSDNFSYLVQIFPFPVLGVILFFEGLALMSLLRDLRADRRDLYVALVVGILANALPYGFLIGLLIGTALYYGQRKIFAGVNA